jgi:hypothetical protein
MPDEGRGPEAIEAVAVCISIAAGLVSAAVAAESQLDALFGQGQQIALLVSAFSLFTGVVYYVLGKERSSPNLPFHEGLFVSLLLLLMAVFVFAAVKIQS